jgi:hypothetical protein
LQSARTLSPRPFIAACVFLLTVGFALRQLRASELASFVEFVTNNLAGAVSVGNYSRPIRLVSECSAGVQAGRNDQNESDYLHCFPPMICLRFHPAINVRYFKTGRPGEN